MTISFCMEDLHLQVPSSIKMKEMRSLWGDGGHWWLALSASSLFLPLSTAPPTPLDDAATLTKK